MTDFAAVQAINTGVVVTERSGATAGTDTVPAGCTLLVRNTGAGAHNINLKCNQGTDGLVTSDRVIGPIAAAAVWTVWVPYSYGDANQRVGIAVDGTPAEVKYSVLAGT